MNDERTAAVPPQDQRYEALRVLNQRYELGELTDDEFKRLKRNILQGAALDEEIRPAQIELLLATYSRFARLDAALDTFRAVVRSQHPRMIDSALISRSASGQVRVRIDAELTRPLVRGQISIVSAVCGLLFPLDTLLVEHRGTPIAASFGAFVGSDLDQTILRSIGNGIPAGTTSILVVCWSAATDLILESFPDVDRFDRPVVGDEIASGIKSILV
jgi:hypothetical protein